MESTTEEVITWLKYYQVPWKRVNGYDIQNEHLCVDKNETLIKGESLSTQLFPVAWYRRCLEGDAFDESIQETQTIKNKGEISRHLLEEFDSLSKWICYKLKDTFWLSNPQKIDINKLIVLDIAESVGLQVPQTMIFSCKRDLEFAMMTYGSLITKSITNSPDFNSVEEDKEYTLYTEEVKLEDLPILPTTFFPTLFQRKIDKAYEVRIFYLNGSCYSMAIFSQKNSKTRVDFRHYDEDMPNRMVPYCLPEGIKIKIQKLMGQLALNTGSIDMIVEKGTKDYYFLEVNPIGQFGMVSKPCNYYLEKKVALFLTYKHRLYEKYTVGYKENTHKTTP